MPRITDWGVKNAKKAAQDEAPDGFYDGPTPPRGVYRTKLKFVRVKKNKNDENMLNGVCECAEPKGSPKAKYNGYGFWFNQNVTEQGAGYLNTFLDAIGAQRSAFWGGKVRVNDEDPPEIIAIGSLKLTGDNVVYISSKANNYNGDVTQQVGRFIVKKKSEEDDEDEDEDFDEDEGAVDEDEDEDFADDDDDDEVPF